MSRDSNQIFKNNISNNTYKTEITISNFYGLSEHHA
jgi:hypothetical protein